MLQVGLAADARVLLLGTRKAMRDLQTPCSLPRATREPSHQLPTSSEPCS